MIVIFVEMARAEGAEQLAEPGIFTVVLPTKNEALNLPQFLASLPPEVQLIVLDDSDDGTPEILTALRPCNTWLVSMSGGVAVKRQRGAELARSEWVLFTDADIQFTPGYFGELKQHLKGDVVFGPKFSSGGHELYYHIFSRGQAIGIKMGLPAASASNMLVRRQALMEVGGFDLRLPCNEDTDLVMRLARAGYKITWAPNLIVHNTDHRRLRRGMLWRYTHILLRVLLLYLSMNSAVPRHWLYSDWGYWRT